MKKNVNETVSKISDKHNRIKARATADAYITGIINSPERKADTIKKVVYFKKINLGTNKYPDIVKEISVSNYKLTKETACYIWLNNWRKIPKDNILCYIK